MANEPGLNITFQATGTLLDMLDHVHQVYGINKSEQTTFLMASLMTPLISRNAQIANYLTILKKLILATPSEHWDEEILDNIVALRRKRD